MPQLYQLKTIDDELAFAANEIKLVHLRAQICQGYYEFRSFTHYELKEAQAIRDKLIQQNADFKRLILVYAQ